MITFSRRLQMMKIYQDMSGAIVLQVSLDKSIVLTLKQIGDLNINLKDIEFYSENNFQVFYYKTYPKIKL